MLAAVFVVAISVTLAIYANADDFPPPLRPVSENIVQLNILIDKTNQIRDIVHMMEKDEVVVFDDVKATISASNKASVKGKYNQIKAELIQAANAIKL